MTDKLKIMTDNEIIKAFKDFLIEQVDGYTDHIETGGERYEFIEKELELLKETDDLINRQKAENERLKNCVKSEDEVMDIAKRTMEPLVKEITREQIDIAVKQAKAEAYKEYIEKVKDEKFKTSVDAYTDAYILGEDDLDNLLKELVGEQNG